MFAPVVVPRLRSGERVKNHVEAALKSGFFIALNIFQQQPLLA